METLKILIFNFNIVNLVNKGILKFLIALMAYLWIALQNN